MAYLQLAVKPSVDSKYFHLAWSLMSTKLAYRKHKQGGESEQPSGIKGSMHPFPRFLASLVRSLTSSTLRPVFKLLVTPTSSRRCPAGVCAKRSSHRRVQLRCMPFCGGQQHRHSSKWPCTQLMRVSRCKTVPLHFASSLRHPRKACRTF